jgi:hypothetical protein
VRRNKIDLGAHAWIYAFSIASQRIRIFAIKQSSQAATLLAPAKGSSRDRTSKGGGGTHCGCIFVRVLLPNFGIFFYRS